VARSSNKRAQRGFVGKYEEKRSLGRHRYRWEVILKISSSSEMEKMWTGLTELGILTTGGVI
jgi:hypothetical protein